MLRALIVFIVLLSGGFFLFHTTLENGSLLAYLDRHPEYRWTPQALYGLGHGYYLARNLPQASLYFTRVEEKFPKSSLAEGAFFYRRQVQDDMGGLTREDTIQSYQAYMDRYPKGKYVPKARGRIESYGTGMR